MLITPEGEVFSDGCFYDFLYFDKMCRLICFTFDFDDFHFCAYRQLGMYFSRHFLGFSNNYKKLVSNLKFCHIEIFKIIKTIKSEGHFPSGHKYATN